MKTVKNFHNNKHKAFRIILTLAILIFLGYFVSGCSQKSADNKQPVGVVSAQAKPSGLTRVKVAEAKMRKLKESLSAPGIIQASKRSSISAKIMGTVTVLNVDEANKVRKGAVLLRIENADILSRIAQAQSGVVEAQSKLYEAKMGRAEGIAGREEVAAMFDGAAAAMKQAKAGLALAEKTYGRMKALYKGNAATKQQLDEAEMNYKIALAKIDEVKAMQKRAKAKDKQMISKISQAEAQINQVSARINQAKAGVDAVMAMRDYSIITAPIDGIITRKNIEVGEMVAPGAPLMTIECIRDLEVIADVESSKIGLINKGEKVTVKIKNIGATIKAKITDIIPSADPMSHTFRIKVRIQNKDGKILPGMYAQINYEGATKEALTIPIEALRKQGQLDIVHVLNKNNTVSMRVITTGPSYDKYIQVQSGIKKGEKVVTESDRPLGNNERVEVIK